MCVDHNNVCVMTERKREREREREREKERCRQQDAVLPCLGLVSAVYSDT